MKVFLILSLITIDIYGVVCLAPAVTRAQDRRWPSSRRKQRLSCSDVRPALSQPLSSSLQRRSARAPPAPAMAIRVRETSARRPRAPLRAIRLARRRPTQTASTGGPKMSMRAAFRVLPRAPGSDVILTQANDRASDPLSKRLLGLLRADSNTAPRMSTAQPTSIEKPVASASCSQLKRA